MNVDKQREVANALLDGKQIQYSSGGGSWVDVSAMVICKDLEAQAEYRVKPEPREVWVNEYESGHLGLSHHSTREAAQGITNPGIGRQIKFREVIDEE